AMNNHNRHGMPAAPVKSEPLPDPTLGCQLRTTFPVARIKRLMQADEDIGKVAQVTPTVVSRALELFMIKLISASAMQARAAATGGSGPKRILVQHLKKAVLADETFDFLREIVDKVPDAPTKGK
ncbi:histone-fold-containing protein, partial [Dissoconium aciculare CBS 342.82]|uniref:Histone-fold-containing protein n=1 Tax=Dissoconium aciculare CBS 342.82 TaxID=1314786 RepID=A0A6J3M360_9PEZI